MIRLFLMNEAEYQIYLDLSIRDYAEDKVQAARPLY